MHQVGLGGVRFISVQAVFPWVSTGSCAHQSLRRRNRAARCFLRIQLLWRLWRGKWKNTGKHVYYHPLKSWKILSLCLFGQLINIFIWDPSLALKLDSRNSSVSRWHVCVAKADMGQRHYIYLQLFPWKDSNEVKIFTKAVLNMRTEGQKNSLNITKYHVAPPPVVSFISWAMRSRCRSCIVVWAEYIFDSTAAVTRDFLLSLGGLLLPSWSEHLLEETHL